MWGDLKEFYASSNLRIFFGFLTYDSHKREYPTDRLLRGLDASDVVYLFLTWFKLGFDTGRLKVYDEFSCRVVICANTLEEHQILIDAGVECILCNQNAFLDPRIFKLAETSPRIYDLVINSKFAAQKRIHLAEGLAARVAIIGYECDGHEVVIPPNGELVNYREGSYRFLGPNEVAQMLNQSAAGGIFSEEEGACFASTEFLFCGLPVVSTKCSGGREVWYNSSNSVIVEPTKEGVEYGVQLALQKLASGEFDRKHIRDQALRMAEGFQSNLVMHVQGVFDAQLHVHKVAKVAVDAKAYFDQNFSHKLGLG